MIVGTGVDICDIRRIERVLSRYGERFLKRVFTEAERARAERRRGSAATLAKRWAAKEACSKALGTGLGMGAAWREIGVENSPSGQPTLRLSGTAARRLAELVPEGHAPRIHLSLTDDLPYAQAWVLIESLPEGTMQ